MNEIVQSGKYAFDIFRVKILFPLSMVIVAFVISFIKAVSNKKSVLWMHTMKCEKIAQGR